MHINAGKKIRKPKPLYLPPELFIAERVCFCVRGRCYGCVVEGVSLFVFVSDVDSWRGVLGTSMSSRSPWRCRRGLFVREESLIVPWMLEVGLWVWGGGTFPLCLTRSISDGTSTAGTVGYTAGTVRYTAGVHCILFYLFYPAYSTSHSLC